MLVHLMTTPRRNPVSRLANTVFIFPINYSHNYIYFTNNHYKKKKLDRIYIFLTFVIDFTIYLDSYNMYAYCIRIPGLEKVNLF